MRRISESTKPLFEIMQEKVNKVVQHYKEDFNYDKTVIMKNISYDYGYYWLLRESGTQMCCEKDLKVADNDWNSLEQIEYFKDYNVKELYYIKIDKVVNGVAYGSIKKLDYDATLKKIKKQMRIPLYLKVSFNKEEVLFDWSSISSPRAALKMIADYFKKNEIVWNQLDYFDYVF